MAIDQPLVHGRQKSDRKESEPDVGQHQIQRRGQRGEGRGVMGAVDFSAVLLFLRAILAVNS
jgi:hypothetical protein